MTPEELGTLLEDAVLLGDDSGVRSLYDGGAVLVGRGWVGGPACALDLLAGWVAGPVTVLGDLAVSVGSFAVVVSRRGSDGCWRVVVTVARRR